MKEEVRPISLASSFTFAADVVSSALDRRSGCLDNERHFTSSISLGLHSFVKNGSSGP